MKRILTCVLALALLFSVCGCAFAGQYLGSLQVVNCNSYVTLRAYASKSSSEVTKVPLGAWVDGWYYNTEFTECTYNGRHGYILSTYLSNGSGGGTAAGGSNYLGKRTIVNCNEFVTLRAQPSTSAAAVTRVARGQTVDCYSYNSQFTECWYNGMHGYILSQYISGGSGGYSAPSFSSVSVVNSLMDQVNFYSRYPSFTAVGSVPSSYYSYWTWVDFFETAGYDEMYINGCSEFVSLRKEANTSSERLVKVPLYAQVRVFGFTQDAEWGLCEYAGEYGWILGEYLYY